MSERSLTRTLHTGLALILGLVWTTAALATLDIPDMPLFLTSAGVAPNIVLTLDDSGSMSRAFTPDLCGNPDDICNQNPDSSLDGRHVKSAAFNPLYYNPEITYTIPPDVDGNNASNPIFTSAYVDGFDTALGYVNLSTGYQPSSGLYVSGGSHTTGIMNHYASDVGCNGGSPRTCTGGRRNRTCTDGVPGTCQLNERAGGLAGEWVNMPGSTSCSQDSDCQIHASKAYYYVFSTSNKNAQGNTCNITSDNADDNCYRIVIVGSTSGPNGTDETQNFANWYSFYRTRNLATISATAKAFNTLPSTTRVAWQALNSCTGDGTLTTSNCRGWDSFFSKTSNKIGVFTGTQKRDFFDWLLRLPTHSSTPLPGAMKKAGEYYRTSGVGSPYDNGLNGGSGTVTEYSCRKNYHVMMTDGIWNTSVSGYGNADSTSQTLPDGTDYSPFPSPLTPFWDDNSNSLADVAFYYWANDLRDLANNVPTNVTDLSGTLKHQYWNAKNDPASWQHMVNFTVGLGLSSFLANTGLTWGGNTYAGSYGDILAGTTDWPTAGSSGPDGNVADLWHAAIDSRGQFYSAENPDALSKAFQDIVNTISSVASNGGGAGLSSTSTNIDREGTLIFEAKFNADWSGQLLAHPVVTGYELGTPYWDAGQRIPPPAARNVFTINDSATPSAFSRAACTGTANATLKDALSKDANGHEDDQCGPRVNWLLGDAKVSDAQCSSATTPTTLVITPDEHGFVAGESITLSDILTGTAASNSLSAQYNGVFTIASADTDTITVQLPAGCDPANYYSGGRVRYTSFRNRQNSVLGDIMDSSPVYVSDQDFGYSSSTVTGSDSYASFVSGKSGPPVIYAGANDGMLHGFQADVEQPGSGVELLAYVPRGVYSNLSKLTSPTYTHTYYVDGPIGVGDAYVGGQWGTYLIGSLGAGGKSIFALNITHPSNFAASDVMWEFTDADLWQTYSKPQIAPTPDAHWSVFIGNGYKKSTDPSSLDDKAFLYVVDLATGQLIQNVATDDTTGNGLSTPYVYATNNDMLGNVVYAGDLNGNLWKFVYDSSLGEWTLGNDGDPLFTTLAGQSITSQPKVAPLPNQGGVLVYFGTGSYLSTGDLTDTHTQSFYAIWDKDGVTGTVSRAALQGYKVHITTTISGYTVRTTTSQTDQASIDWNSQRGWYLDLPASTNGAPSERIIATPLLMQFTGATPSRVLFVTNTPASDPCSRGGTTWLMELDLYSGTATPTSVFDFNNDSKFDINDTIGTDQTPASGVALSTSFGLTGDPLLLNTNDGQIVKEFAGTTGHSGVGGPGQQGQAPGGSAQRIYWKQIH